MSTTKIALTGFARSGKTVFLTSLLWHLMGYNESYFSLGDNCKKFVRFRDRPEMEKLKGPFFPYEAFRENLGKRKWPEPTNDLQYYYLECGHKLDRFDYLKRWMTLDFSSISYIEFMDFPGERLGDLPIFKNKKFCEWSTFMFRQFGFDEFHNELESLNRDVADDNVFAKQAVVLYKRCVAKLYLGSRSLVSPVSIILQKTNIFSGYDSDDKSQEALIKFVEENSVSGFDPEKQFCPLPNDIIESRPAVYKQFSSNYKYYSAKYVEPFFNELLSVDSMAVLIDIPNILASGSGKLEDQKALLRQVFDTLPTTIFSKRIAFVASKADLVGEKNQSALKNLLNAMVDSLDFYNRTISECFLCSACASIDRNNLCYPNGAQSGELMKIDIVDLPQNWPMNWSKGTFKFPNVLPKTELNSVTPPQHHNLNKVFNFLVGNNK